MARPAMAVGALLGTVTQTANTLTLAVSTVNDSVGMLHSFVNRHSVLQQDKNLVELDNARVRLIRDSAREVTQQEEEIETYLKGNPTRIAAYNAAHNRIAALFNPTEA